MKLHGLGERFVRVLAQQNGRVLRRTFGELFKAGVLEIDQRKLWQLQCGDKRIHQVRNVAWRHGCAREQINMRVIKVPEVKQQPILIGRSAQARERGDGALTKRALLQLAHAKFHGRRIQVHAKSIGREMVQTMRIKAGNVRCNFKPRVAKFGVQTVVARVASPFEDAVDSLAHKGVEIVRIESALSLIFFYEIFCAG